MKRKGERAQTKKKSCTRLSNLRTITPQAGLEGAQTTISVMVPQSERLYRLSYCWSAERAVTETRDVNSGLILNSCGSSS